MGRASLAENTETIVHQLVVDNETLIVNVIVGAVDLWKTPWISSAVTLAGEDNLWVIRVWSSTLIG